MVFAPGNPGRPKGSENKLTKTVRETFEKVFHELQGDPKHNLLAFAREEPKEFYKIASKLIPVDVAVQGGLVLQVLTGVPTEQKQIATESHPIIDVTPTPAEVEYDGSDLV